MSCRLTSAFARPQASRGAWRLPGLSSEGGVEEGGIRVPPLAPGARFNDVYEARLGHVAQRAWLDLRFGPRCA